MGPAELAEQHPHELTPGRQPLAAILGTRLPDEALEFNAWTDLEYLTEHAA